ncbi:MAG: hypothetical protein ACI318_02780 [Bacilli bacterium]
MKKSSKRLLPVIISFFALVAVVLSLALPFMYSSLDDAYIVGFCMIFGGTYKFSSTATSTNVHITFSWGLFIGLIIALLCALYSFFVCRKTNKANSIITFLFLVASSVLFFLASRFCQESIQANLGYLSSVEMSFGSYVVASLLGIDALLALVDTCKK